MAAQGPDESPPPPWPQSQQQPGEQLVSLCRMVMEQEVQIRVLSDLSTNIVRAHLAFREHYSHLRKQVADLRSCLERKGVVAESDLSRTPSMEELPSDLTDPIVLPASSHSPRWPSWLTAVGISGASEELLGRHWASQSSVDTRLPARALPWACAPAAGLRVCVFAGLQEVGRLSATCRQSYMVLWTLLTARPPLPAKAADVSTNSRARTSGCLLQDMWQHSAFLENMALAMDAGSLSRLCAVSRSAAERVWMQKPPKLKPHREMCRSAGGATRALLHDLWQYRTLSDALTSAMDQATVQQFVAASRGCRECTREWILMEQLPGGLPHFRLGRVGRGSDDEASSHSIAGLSRRTSFCSSSFLEVQDGQAHEEEEQSKTVGGEKPGKGSKVAGLHASALLGNVKPLVRLQGLQQRPELNGQEGELVGAVAGSDRWLVTTFGGESLRVRMTNIVVLVRGRQSEGGVAAAKPEQNKAKPAFAKVVGEGMGSLLEAPAPLETVRKRPKRLYIVGGCSGVNMVPFADVYNMETGQYEPVSESMSRPRFHMCTSAVGSSLYVIGGFDGNTALKTCERLDTATGAWEALPPMSRPRTFACSALVGGHIYVAGGCISGQGHFPSPRARQVALSSAERYSVRQRTWQLLPPMLQCRAFGVAAPISKRHFMVCGGYDSRVLVATECFVPSTDGAELGEWRRLPQMQHGGFSAAQAQDEFGNLYVCGGAGDACTIGGLRTGLRHAQRFHSVLHTWEVLPPMQEARCGGTAGAVGGGKICVCGGFGTGPQSKTSAELFDPTAFVWSYLAPMREARSFHVSYVAEGRLYAFGGKAGQKVLRSGECYHFATSTWEELPEMSFPRTGAAMNAI